MSTGLFHINEVKPNFEPQKRYLYDLELIGANVIVNNPLITDSFAMQCNAAQIPLLQNDPIESIFKGQKKYFRGMPEMTNSLTVTCEEKEDQAILLLTDAWLKQSFNIETGSGGALSPSGYKIDARLTMYEQDKQALAGSILFKGLFLVNREASQLGWSQNERVDYNLSFKYDYFKTEFSNQN